MNPGNGLEETLYYCQDANWNVTALVSAAGAVVERYMYDPCGKATVLDEDRDPVEGNPSAVTSARLFQGEVFSAWCRDRAVLPSRAARTTTTFPCPVTAWAIAGRPPNGRRRNSGWQRGVRPRTHY